MTQNIKQYSSNYFASYMQFFISDPKQVAYIMGTDNSVGDPLYFKTKINKDGLKTYVFNRFKKSIGELNASDSHTIRVYIEKKWYLTGVLDFIAVQSKEKVSYCVQIVMFAVPKIYEKTLNLFTKNFGQALSVGKRRDPFLTKDEQQQMLYSKGNFLPKRKLPIKKENDFKYLKTEASLKEKIIEQCRQKKPCYYVFNSLFLALTGVTLILLTILLIRVI